MILTIRGRVDAVERAAAQWAEIRGRLQSGSQAAEAEDVILAADPDGIVVRKVRMVEFFDRPQCGSFIQGIE